MSQIYRTLINKNNVYAEQLIQLAAFTPSGSFLPSHAVVNTSTDTITTSGTGTGTFKAILLYYIITPESGFTTSPYSIGVNAPVYGNSAEDLSNVTGTNTKLVWTSTESDGGFDINCTADDVSSFWIKAHVGFQFRVSFTIEYWLCPGLGSPYALTETYTSALAPIQTL